jgi:hypothetical protein
VYGDGSGVGFMVSFYGMLKRRVYGSFAGCKYSNGLESLGEPPKMEMGEPSHVWCGDDKISSRGFPLLRFLR